jgi:hypothetical protein
MQIQLPTASIAHEAREALSAAGVSARVRQLRFSVRVCPDHPTDTDRLLATSALDCIGLRGVCNTDLTWEAGYQAFAYKVS